MSREALLISLKLWLLVFAAGHYLGPFLHHWLTP